MATDIIGVKGADIRAARYAKGLKIYELAEKVGINPSHLSAIERGTKHGSPAVLVRIAEALGKNPERFITNQPRVKAA
jgi:transcriptional regulator with XRE-family HTH domain